MISSSPIPHRPLGLIKTLLEDAGYNLTHCYEDLVFVEHNAFLLRMEEQGEDLSIFFNDESDPDKRGEITTNLSAAAARQDLVLTRRGTYSLEANEETETIDIIFQDDSISG